MTPKLTIQIVGWNSAARLPQTLAPLTSIPRDEVIIRYLDNASTDGSTRLVRRHVPHAEVIELPSNRGFAGAHNEGFKRCLTSYVLVLNPDAVLLWDGVCQLLPVFVDERVGAVQGKIYRHIKHRVLDSCGIVMTAALNGVDRGAGDVDRGLFDNPANIAAVTGAAGLYRMAALRGVAHGEGEVYDEDFFAYKEDVDLGWRLKRAGWSIKYLPVPMAIHGRVLGADTELGWSLNPRRLKARLRDRRTYDSLRNWVWMLIKNLTWREELRAELFIDARLIFFFGLSLLYWPLLRVWPEIIRGIPKMIEKRKSLGLN